MISPTVSKRSPPPFRGRDRTPAERERPCANREILLVGDVSIREIARRVGVAASTMRTTIKRFQAAGLAWPLPKEMTDAALEARLSPRPASSRVIVVKPSRTGRKNDSGRHKNVNLTNFPVSRWPKNDTN
jgi:transposase-like protein